MMNSNQYPSAFADLTKSAAKDKDALYALALCYYHGIGVDKNHVAAFKHFESIVKDEFYLQAFCDIANCYSHGIGTNPDSFLAFEYYKKAADKGYGEAHKNLARHYYYGPGMLNPDYGAALKHANLALEQGIIEANYILGVFYFHGRGVDQDYNLAIEYLKKAENSRSAKYHLGLCYKEGAAGCAKNSELAIQYFKEAADLGHKKSQFLLGTHYRDPNTGDQNIELAIKYFQEAADSGHPEAQHIIGQCFYNGNLLPLDKGKAIKYFELAAGQNYEPARESLRECYLNGSAVNEKMRIIEETLKNSEKPNYSTNQNRIFKNPPNPKLQTLFEKSIDHKNKP